jgi:transposase
VEKSGRLLEIFQRCLLTVHLRSLETTSRKHRVTVATLTDWRDRFLAAGESSLKSRETDAEDEEKKRLRSVVASVCLDNELLREKIARLENGRPLAPWKSRS